MSVNDIQQLVQYVTDSQGTQTGVMVPIALWEKILETLDRGEKGLSPIDEDEPKERVLSDLEDAVRSTRSGIVFPMKEQARNSDLPSLEPATVKCGNGIIWQIVTTAQCWLINR